MPPAAVNHGMSLAQSPVANLPVDEDNEKTKVHRGLESLEGEIISDRYQIIKRIGKGGMGVVYLAQQTKLNRNVCLKVLNPALLDDEDAVSRFEREAKGLSRLQHPNIVTIFDYGRDGDLAYIVMEYAQGETLSKFLKVHGALHIDQFLPIAVQILKGIGEAHKLGLIHRDIKPANIILGELEGERFVKILDFGLAKLAQGQEDVTKDQQLVGSASYMAPEQILTGHSDTRTDVYALGVMFYLMLAGQKPFSGANDNVILYKHVNEIPKDLRELVQPFQEVPEPLCDVIMQCLSKDCEKRPQTANDMLVAFSHALDAPQIRAGYSSMSLSHLDIKGADEADTHTIPSSIPAGLSAAGESSGEVSHVSSVSSVSRTGIGQSDIYIVQANPRDTQEARDRKILFVLLSLIGIVVVVIVVVILTNFVGNKQETPAVVQQVGNVNGAVVNDSANDANDEAQQMEALFAEIQGNINGNNLELAENAIKILENSDKASVPAYLIRISQLRTQIDKLNQAKESMDNENYDAAIDILEEVLREDDSNLTAKSMLEQINALPTVVFKFDGDRSKTELLVGDVSKGSLPEKIRFKTPGKYQLLIKSEGYKDWVREENVEAGNALEFSIELEKAAPAAKTDSSKSSKSSSSGSGKTLTVKPKTGSSKSSSHKLFGAK